MNYLIYFIGPFLFGLVGALVLRQRFRVFVIGLAVFLLAWTVMQTIAGVATKGFNVAEGSWPYALIVSLSAGIFEELGRYLAFRQFAAFHDNHNGRSSLMYAIGHHGMETIIVGLTLVLIYALVRYKPDAISDPTTLQRCREMLALPPGVKAYNACERLFVGCLIHACFSGVVMLCFIRGQIRWLFVAGLWHLAHNLVGFNLHRLSEHWIVSKGWIAFIVIGYTYLLVRLYRWMPPAPVSREPDGHSAPPPMILPGRPAGG